MLFTPASAGKKMDRQEDMQREILEGIVDGRRGREGQEPQGETHARHGRGT